MANKTPDPKAKVPIPPVPALVDRLTFLVHSVAARVATVGNRHFRAHDLNHYSARILVLLLEREELRAGELVELMALPQSTISSQLQALHAKRLVRRRRSRKDNRSVIITLTPIGVELARDCDGLSVRVHEVMLAGISEKEKQVAFGLLRKVNARLQELEQHDVYQFRAPKELEAPVPAPAAAPVRATRKRGVKP